MKNLKDIVLERLVLSKSNNRDDFNIINKLLDGRSLDLERLFSGNNKNVNKTHSNGTVWFLNNKKPGELFELVCSDKYGNTSDVGTIRNNDELYDFLSTRLKNSMEKEFIDILIKYLQDHFVQENINERLILNKTKQYLSYKDLLKTKVGDKLGTYCYRNEDNWMVYLYYYSLTLNGKDVAYLEDWSDGDEFGERWQIIIIPDELFDSLNLEEDTRNGGFIVPENIKNHIINIFEFDENENIDIMSVSIWYSLRNDEKYYGNKNSAYYSFINKIYDNL